MAPVPEPTRPDRRGGRRGPRTDDGRTTGDRAGRAHGGGARRSGSRRNPGPDPARLERAAAARAAVVLPPITYPEQLPVSARREEIAAAIAHNQVVVVSGETGSGKTTQLPKIALELGRGRTGQIGHTQPRRIAARSVAERVAAELGTPLGEAVGYQVRFTDTSSDSTLVRVMTDGILLAQIQRDPMLLAYDTIIVDEAHERSLNIDFLLGYLTNLLPRRPDLTLIITSATIDSARFAEHFGREGADGVRIPAPVVEVTGRTYPVEVRYRPLDGERDMVTGITEAVDELIGEGPGDILVFASGEREIRDAADALRTSLGTRVTDPRSPGAVELLPLFSRLSAAEQHKVFEPHSARRVVLATNVAETSLTVPGVRYVVDPGTARISRYSKATKVQRLPIEPISQASANQRSGRCGRLSDGIAIRLYSQEDYTGRPEFTEPEILRTSLASVILQMVAVGVVETPDDVARFPFVDPPDTRSVRDGVALLTELGALAADETGHVRLTATGKALARLPVDPRLARMVVEAGRRGVAREVVVIAAALSIQDPRERPTEQREQADALHRRFVDPGSDLLTYLNLWTWLRAQRRELSGSALRRRLRGEHLNYLRVREWQDVVTQLHELSKELHIDSSGAPRPVGDTGDDDPERTTWTWDGDRVHQSVLAGLLSQIGMQEATEVRAGQDKAHGKAADPRASRRPRNDYLGARGARFALWPGSALSRRPPAWVMAAELVETSRLWGRDAARIRPEWAEELGAHLVKKVYSEPAWSTRQGAATVTEKVFLYGVPLVADRRVLLAKVDAPQARELFIRHALVEGAWTTHHAFFADNRRLLGELAELEARARRRDLLVDDDVLFDFYDERVPDTVVSAAHFDRWWKEARRTDPELLTFTRELLVGPSAEQVDDAAFPSTWPHRDLQLPLTYEFEPGSSGDGVRVHVPLTALSRMVPDGFDWLVPGMRAELLTATIRALPKAVRVQLVPAPDVARAVDAWMEQNLATWADTVRAADAAPGFHEAFAQAVRALRDVQVPPDAFDDDRLPAHLRMTFLVEDSAGRVLDQGKDLAVLQRRLAGKAQQAVSSAVRTAVQAAMSEARPTGTGWPSCCPRR
ncbi:ATP-dependent RNA helicase HrpA, partial [Cellulomonas citrea]|uniref:ATP-dependent RNA helicase HrpA n=1 Tax=Cellulomonas citrea TaxID=1909423 RepID=UPI00135CC417